QQVSPFAFQDYNDEIRQEQLRELSYLNGSEDSARGRGIRGRGIRVPPAAPSRGRGGAIPPPPPGRGAQAPRGAPVTRGALPVPPVARGVPTPRARGAPAVPGYRPPPPPAHEAYEEYGYDDGYGGEYDDPSYEAYDNSYATQTQSVPEYYDYGHGTSEEAYDSYAQEEWATTRSSLKAPPPRSARGGYREHPYGRY
ncbi:KH domain-containing, RNA-binding, signal transduction-associated protein 2, partial [Charadrius vociferus]